MREIDELGQAGFVGDNPWMKEYKKDGCPLIMLIFAD